MARASRASRLRAVDEEYSVSLSRVEEFAEQLPDKYLHCRELGHLWRPWKAGHHPDGGYTRTLRCTRCRTKREQELSERGMVMTSRYIHPEGYLSEGIGRITGEGRGLLRLASIKRVLTDEEEE